jgi:SSS family solute:Na+ symporter
MARLDVLVIVLYFLAMIALGFRYRKRASLSLEAYFLGEKRLHWLPLAMSGSVSNFDITGTMWIVSIIFLLGLKSMWHHWMWGFMMGAFFMVYMGKWVRRSNVMTAAEWMKTRFGDGRAGRLARTAYALMAVLTQASFIGYAFQGIGKFAAIYIPLESLAAWTSSPLLRRLVTDYEPHVLAVLIMGITTLYVLLGGLLSVVVTDVIQTVILSLAGLFIAVIAWARISPAMLKSLPEDFVSLRIPWRIPEFGGTANAQFEFFGALVIIWVLKGLLMNAGGPAQMYDFQRFLAAKSDRDASKIGAAWSVFLVIRWAMVMGIALLALTGAAGTADAEKVMPLVLRDYLPLGVRGVVIAGLLAAFMSTFSSTVNSGASFIVRDIWQLHIKKEASERQAVRFSYLATMGLVLLGIVIGFQGRSIAEIWNWMMVALGGGVIVPNVLRWYWWRMNGWGYAWGLLGGMVLSLIVLFFKGLPQYVVFPLVVSGSLLMSILGSLLTRPVDDSVLEEFFRSVRPWGAWGPVKKAAGLSSAELSIRSEKAPLGLLNVLLGMAAIGGLYLFPMFLVGRWYGSAAAAFGASAAAVTVLYFTWYRNLSKV